MLIAPHFLRRWAHLSSELSHHQLPKEAIRLFPLFFIMIFLLSGTFPDVKNRIILIPFFRLQSQGLKRGSNRFS